LQNRKIELSYIEILKDSLQKKIVVLDKINEINKIQAEIIKEEKFDFEKFDETILNKKILIDELNLLDNGFQKVYDRVKELFETDKELYTEDIRILKVLVKEVMDKSIDIEAFELRNKESFEKRTEVLRKTVKVAKATNKVAADYYQNMNKTSVIEPQFMDWKK
jgi:predicted nuclease with TOPRIM domain